MRDIYPFLRKSAFWGDYTVCFSAFDGVINDFLFSTENLLSIIWKPVKFWV